MTVGVGVSSRRARDAHLSTSIICELQEIFTIPADDCAAYHELPGQGVTVVQGRCTWDTGWFHETLIRRALTTLGYTCEAPKMLQNPMFYASVVQGTVHFWANSWFPNQYPQLPKNFREKAGEYGYVMKAGGLQGYLIDKKHQ